MKIEPNKVYLGDNLEVMEQIPDDFINLIYIDPPFYSQEDYGDFNDKWNSLNDYLDFMKQRIKQTYRILKKTGSFYLHCDYHASHYLKIICDEIYRYENFRSEIIWVNGSTSGFKGQKKGWIRDHDCILYYVKDVTEKFTFNKMHFPYSKQYYKKYRHKDKDGRKFTISNGRRIYLDERRGIPISDVWDDILSYQTRTRSKEYTGYKTQKPYKLLERIILASTNEEDLVADFFCGSGTTCVVSKALNRKWIGVDKNPEAIDMTTRLLKNTKINKEYRLKVKNVVTPTRQRFLSDNLQKSRKKHL